MKLRISPDLSLPAEEAVTRSFAVLGMRGSGKSNAAVVLAEEMYRAGLHWVTIDPKGDWWGIRSSGEGKAAGGLPVVILGGEHQDVALDPSAQAGVTLADVILGEELTCVLDLSEFSKRQKIEFLAGVGAREGFAERLFRKKKREASPLHIFMDEAHDYVPQQASGEVAKLIEVVSKWQTQGRQRGIGASVLSQRSARVHKDVLTQCDVLVAMRTIGPQDRKAIEEWLKYHGQSQEILASLAELADGEAWVWSPEWLGVTKRIRFHRRKTYDSGSTPTRGASRRRPATLADIDLSALEHQMAAAITAAKAEDPKELQKRIRDLERQLTTTTKVQISPEVVVERVEVPVFSDGEVEFLADTVGGLNATAGLLGKEGARLSEVSSALGTAAIKIERALEDWTKRTPTGPPTGVAHHAGVRAPARPRASVEGAGRGGPTERKTAGGSARDRPPPPDSARIAAGGELTGPARKILDSIAWWEMVGYPKPTKQQVGIIAGYRVGKKVGGHYGNTLGALRSAGLVEYPDAGRVVLTEEGRQHADVADLAPSTASLQSAVFARLSEPEGRILKVLVDVYPEALPKQELGARAGYEVGDRVGGHFGNLLGRLRTLGLIDYPSPGTAAADPVLFLEER